MAANISDVDVILKEDAPGRPNCQHGPTLLFVKYTGEGNGRQFYACSAFRDRKECNFFQWKDEKVTENKKAARETVQRESELSYRRLKKRCHKLRKLKATSRVFCATCGQFLLPEEVTDHTGHDRKSALDDGMLQRPSLLFKPLDNNKTYAQYLFSESTIQFTVNLLQKLNITHVLCIGAPRIHEAIQSNRGKSGELDSLLLDLDQRYQQIYPPEKFCSYNMFNNYFFNDEESEKILSNFVTEIDGKRVAMVTDPPFGGLVEVLVSTINSLMQLWKENATGTNTKDVYLDVHVENYLIKGAYFCVSENRQLPVLWFFPYFMEKRITECLPDFSMLDYKVDYDNHALFRGDVKKHGSPVRIFTNIAQSEIVLPSAEGYWYCSECNRYSGPENVHCQMCDSCTSKDGRTYRHCFKCDRCVKPSKVHCDKCNICQLKDHKCGQVLHKGCHICGDLNHKRKSCPNKGKPSKRKKSDEDIVPVKRKRVKK